MGTLIHFIALIVKPHYLHYNLLAITNLEFGIYCLLVPSLL